MSLTVTYLITITVNVSKCDSPVDEISPITLLLSPTVDHHIHLEALHRPAGGGLGGSGGRAEGVLGSQEGYTAVSAVQ